MSQTVLVTGTGRPYALGFNFVKRYLENGDTVLASIRRPSEALEALKKEYPESLYILTMDISSTASVHAAAAEAAQLVPAVDLIVNNATTASADTMKELPEFDLDQIAPAVAEKEHNRCADCEYLLRSRKHRKVLPHFLSGLWYRKSCAEYAYHDPA